MTWEASKAAARFAASGQFSSDFIEATDEKILSSCHPKQRQFVEDPHRRVSALVGRRGGKTTGARARLLRKMLRIPRARCLYIATTRVAAEQLMWIEFKDLLEKLHIEATFNETQLKCTLRKNGSTLRLVGASDAAEIDKLRGLKFHEVAIDEAASFIPEKLDMLIDRVIGPTLGDYRGVLVMFGTPSHILRGQFYNATYIGSTSHRLYADRNAPEYAGWTSWSSHAWTLLDGAAHVQTLKNAWDEALVEKADKQWSDDHPIWKREWLGQWSADNSENVFKYRPHVDGVPWNQWDPERIGPLKFAKLPTEWSDWCHVIAMDEGFSDPFALNVFAFSLSDPMRTIYHRYGCEFKKLYATPIAKLLIGDDLNHDKLAGVIGVTGWPDAMVADMGDAMLAELLEVRGIRIQQAPKGYKYKFPAIEVVNGDLVDGRIKILKGSLLEQQLMTLEWQQLPTGALIENKAQANHSTDTLIYGRNAIGSLLNAMTSGSGETKQQTSPWDEPSDDVRAVPNALDDLVDASYDAWEG